MLYIDESQVTGRMTTDLPPCSRLPRNGYGNKIPTNFMLRYKGYWRRVYVVCSGAMGTSYILVKRQPVYIASHSDVLTCNASNFSKEP
jgi:hypothetical protein